MPLKAAGGPLDFASELAAKLGGKIPVKQDNEDEEEHEEAGWSDDERSITESVNSRTDTPKPRTETTKSRSESKVKEKKGHGHHDKHHHGDKHHHHGDKSKGGHGHRRKRHDSRTSKASLESSMKKDDDGKWGEGVGRGVQGSFGVGWDGENSWVEIMTVGDGGWECKGIVELDGVGGENGWVEMVTVSDLGGVGWGWLCNLVEMKTCGGGSG